MNSVHGHNKGAVDVIHAIKVKHNRDSISRVNEYFANLRNVPWRHCIEKDEIKD